MLDHFMHFNLILMQVSLKGNILFYPPALDLHLEIAALADQIKN